MKNKKIANLRFKEPYSTVSKIENKSDFLSMQAFWDFLKTRLVELI